MIAAMTHRRPTPLATLALALALALLAGCGGGKSGAPGEATIGAAGGTVAEVSGAQVVFPRGALAADVTVRITRDSTGAPPLPAAATPAGAVYAITPHGQAFGAHAEVSIPVETTELAAHQQLLLVTAEPGDTQWRVLSGATYASGLLRAPVMHFSFFRAIVLTEVYVPSLVTTVATSGGASNNVGGAGIGRFSPDFEFGPTSGFQYDAATLRASLTFPSPPPAIRTGLTSLPPQRACLPTDYGHGGAAWRFQRDGAPFAADGVQHDPIEQMADGDYPRNVGEICFDAGWWCHAFQFQSAPAPGFGALHVYGQDTPRRGALWPAGSADPWALPPAGNVADDDRLMWIGTMLFDAEHHNGRVRIDTTVATDCGLTLEAVPLAFQLNLASRAQAWQPYQGVFGIYPVVNAPSGLTAELPFVETFDGQTASIAWEYSHDAANWERLPVPAQYVRDDGPIHVLFDPYEGGHAYSIAIPNVQPGQAGWYRAWACSAPVAATSTSAAIPSLCTSQAPVQLVVLTAPPTLTRQPAPQTVLVGEAATFVVDAQWFWELPGVLTTGAPDLTVQWQRRPLVEAAFGLGTWTDVEGANDSVYVTPATTLADTGTLYRAVVSSVLGSTASEAALLTVLEQLAPPVVVSQPGNLNVTLGSSAAFAAAASGTPPLAYQWRRDGVAITGATGTILTLTGVTAADDGLYDLVVTNRAGSVTSQPARLQVMLGTPVPLLPSIAAPPASITVAEGDAANFAVAVTGTGPYTYLWMKDGVPAPLPGGDGPSFSIAAVSAADAGAYSVQVTNDVGTAVSAAATLTVTGGGPLPVAPTISTQPATLVVLPGAAATLAVAASGTGPLLYQWYRGGLPVAGATGAVLHLASVGAADAGTYTVTVGNAVGSVDSSAAQLILVGAPAITVQPADATAPEGGTATFQVTATGEALRYQWTRNQVAIDGATAASYTTPPLTLADGGAVFGVIVYNGAGLVFGRDAVLTVVPGVPVSRVWGAAGLIETDDVGEATRARVAMDASGNAIAVWQQNDAVRSNVWANRYEAASQAWGVPTLLETGDAGGAFEPQIAVAGSGDAVAVWYQDDGTGLFDVWASRYVAATGAWDAPTLLETSTATARSPRVAVDGAGNAMVAWSQSSGTWAIRYTAGAGWDVAAQRIEDNVTSSAGAPELAVGASGDAFAVWTSFDGTRNNIWANRYDAATGAWESATLIETGNVGLAEAPHVAVDAGGNAVAVWTYFDGARYDILATRYAAGGGGWDPVTPSLTATATGSGDAPRVALDGAGNALVVWAQSDAGRYSIWANRLTAGAGWGGAALIEADDAGDAALPQLAVDGAGNAVAVWYQFDGTRYDVLSNRFTPGAGWGTAALLETGAGNALRPHVAVSPAGDATAVWDQREGSRTSIWSSAFR